IIVAESGLKGEYFNGRNNFFNGFAGAPSLVRVDPTVDFDFGTGSPAPGVIGVDDFAVRWTGRIKPRFSETYTFFTITDDGVRLYVNDQLIINNPTDHGPTTDTGTITLVAGQSYNIRME